MLNLKRKQELTLRIRKSDWVDKVTFIVNGKVEYPTPDKNGYWMVNRTWARKDKTTSQLPMYVYVESLMGSDRHTVLLYGPYILIGRMGAENLPTTFWGKMNDTAVNKIDLNKIPVSRMPPEQIPAYMKSISANTLKFKIDLREFDDVVVEPFYRVRFERYVVYQPVSY